MTAAVIRARDAFCFPGAAQTLNVMPGLVPGIYVFVRLKTWMAGMNPAMTSMVTTSFE
jgi:hypothetical protein